MRVRLEIDRREELSFHTLTSPIGEYRDLRITIDGREFHCWYPLSPFMERNEGYLRNVDDRLAREFEYMIERLLTVACKMVPDGFDLKNATDDEIRIALIRAYDSIPGVKTEV